MTRLLRSASMFVAYALFAGFMGYFSVSPPFAYSSADLAVVKVSLSHATERVAPCILLTPQEIAALAPNMRRAEKCGRARLPLVIELELDGELILASQALPSGLWGDGPASFYQRFGMRPGNHRLSARLRDSDRSEGWDYTHSQDVTLQAGRYLTVTFRAENGGFEFR